MLKTLKKYGKILILLFILFILTETTFTINRLIERNLEQQETDTTLKKLQEMIDKSGAKEKGLNEYQVIWDYDLRLLKEKYPEDNAILFEYIDKETWNSELDTLIDDISKTLLTDNEIFERVKEIIPEKFQSDAFDDYLLSIKVLNPDLFNENSTT
ncbi:hypothetical protein [Clostridium sp. Marseille-P299]|uniref:hypothetical protein n=1 Tax=Clostridium sp. Marseille-P299 TaxID=1805477 RepID=UPI00082EC158|nr:hypothetical protein [Clostridium sp. Marseille-P299]